MGNTVRATTFQYIVYLIALKAFRKLQNRQIHFINTKRAMADFAIEMRMQIGHITHIIRLTKLILCHPAAIVNLVHEMMLLEKRECAKER